MSLSLCVCVTRTNTSSSYFMLFQTIKSSESSNIISGYHMNELFNVNCTYRIHKTMKLLCDAFTKGISSTLNVSAFVKISFLISFFFTSLINDTFLSFSWVLFANFTGHSLFIFRILRYWFSCRQVQHPVPCILDPFLPIHSSIYSNRLKLFWKHSHFQNSTIKTDIMPERKPIFCCCSHHTMFSFVWLQAFNWYYNKCSAICDVLTSQPNL